MFLNRLISIDPTIFHPGGNSHIKVMGVLIGKLKLYPQGRPMWVWLKLKLTSKGEHTKNRLHGIFCKFFMQSPKRYLNGQNVVTFLPKHPKWDQNLQFARPKRDYEHPQSLLYGSPPGLSLYFIVRSGWYWPSLVPFHQGNQHVSGFTSDYF